MTELQETPFTDIGKLLAEELQVKPHQVLSAIRLLDDGMTVPFISRYRKEVTGGMTDTHLRALDERLAYLRELEDRRSAILESIDKTGQLSEDLKTKIEAASTKAELEDLYLPFKPRRRTKAQIAREAGLEPLAEHLLSNPEADPEISAKAYLNPECGIDSAEAALDGARLILMERFSENAELVGRLRSMLSEDVWLVSSPLAGADPEKSEKFKDYLNYQEKLSSIPSHRLLAALRGRKEGVLKIALDINPYSDNPTETNAPYIHEMTGILKIDYSHKWLMNAVQMAWTSKIKTSLDIDLMIGAKKKAEKEAIKVFAENLRNLLLAAPAGTQTVMGLDPGFRTGVKLCVISPTGKVTFTGAIFPHPPQDRWSESIEILEAIVEKFKVDLIAIGNGTASRETDRLVTQTIKQCGLKNVQKIVVSEAGASVYSASELAAKELPDLDVTVRGAVSIARRLQDPLSELVKIDPKSIGVGQYQHDVDQAQLMKSLKGVVEDCVNAVGVDVNTASVELLSYISGLNQKSAENLIQHRHQNGPFQSREEFRQIKDFGPRTFELAAGFLKIPHAANPLDGSAVHPESYAITEKMIADNGMNLSSAIGNPELIRKIKPEAFVTDTVGLPTITDILSELEKPGRDPRGEFIAPSFKDGVETLNDLKVGMKLEGSVTNVAQFGAFVDIGVHQDGLVHISELADCFVEDPHEFVRPGQIVKVTVLEIDKNRGRISLSMKQKRPKNDRNTSDQSGRGFNRIQNL